MFYRSGWLRCDVWNGIRLCLSGLDKSKVFVCVFVNFCLLGWCSRFELVLDDYYIISYPSLFSSSVLISSNPPILSSILLNSQSFYTCRHLHILTYIQSLQSSVLLLSQSSTILISSFPFRHPIDILTPHVLSEWMVEVWCVYKYRYPFLFNSGVFGYSCFGEYRFIVCVGVWLLCSVILLSLLQIYLFFLLFLCPISWFLIQYSSSSNNSLSSWK